MNIYHVRSVQRETRCALARDPIECARGASTPGHVTHERKRLMSDQRVHTDEDTVKLNGGAE